MSKQKGIILALGQLALFALFAGVLLAKGGLYIRQHEGDTLHLLQILLRMADGQTPHLEFVTPIGILAFLPIVVFIKAGFDAGQAFILGQILVGALFFPAIWWASMTRLAGVWRYIFMVAMMVLCMGLIHGEADPTLSVSMHYNRWAWAAAFLAIVTALLAPRHTAHPMPDGVLIGVGFAVMAMIKVTYFAAFLPAVLVALFMRGAGKTVLWALLSGLVAVALMTLYVGTPMFWLFYLADLLNVAGSPSRSAPGLPIADLLSAPAYLPGTILALMAVILLRQSGQMREGLVLMLLLPGFVYVTYQNFGNDPQWIGLIGILLIALLPDRPVFNGFGWDLGRGMLIVAGACLVLALPSFLNIAQSPFRHLLAKHENYVPLLAGRDQHQDILSIKIRAYRIDAGQAMDGPDTIFAKFHDPKMREEWASLQGETLPWCSVDLGMVAWFSTLSDDLIASGLVEDKAVFVADLLPTFWMFGAGRPVPGAAPWYYGGLTGLQNADLLLVPQCALSMAIRKQILEEVTEAGLADKLKEIRRTPEYILYQLPNREGGSAQSS